eukprot:713288_1
MARQPFKDFCASEDGSISCTLTTPPSNGLCTDQMVAKQFLGCFDLMSDSAGVTLIRTQKQDSSMTDTQKKDPSIDSMTGFGTLLMVIIGFAAIVGGIWFACSHKGDLMSN